MCCVVLLSSIFGFANQSIPDNRAEDERMLREMEIEASRALVAKDLDHLISLYADDASIFYADNRAVTGKAAIRETWRTILVKPGFAMSTEPLKVQVSDSGDLAFIHGAYTMTMDDAMGKSISDKGEYVVVYKKQPDGKWKVFADSGNSDFRVHSLPKSPDRRQQPASSIGPLVGLACFFSGIWFLFGMPVVVAVLVWKCWRNRKFSAGLLVAVVMVIVFFGSATLLWRHFATHLWNFSFMTALHAAGDAATYGHPIEHTAEVLLANLLIFSTLSAAAAGAITGALQRLWIRHRRLAV
jgi:uncharacterized protein (TIGR02246 family)